MQELAGHLQGTCMSLAQACDAVGIEGQDDSDLEAELLGYDVERCGVCDWWCEVCELEFDEAAGHGVCGDCR